MDYQMSEEEIYEEAKKRVEAKRGFYKHLVIYVIVNALLVIIWAFPGGRGHQWFWYPIGGWGIAIVINFFEVFILSRKGERAAIAKEVEKLKRENR